MRRGGANAVPTSRLRRAWRHLSSPRSGPLIGSSTWCDDHVPALERALEPQCAPDRIAGEHWYRSQALLGHLGVDGSGGRAASPCCVRPVSATGFAPPLTVMALALLPAASATLVQTFHPQDLVCVGLLCMAMGQALRRRWVLTGVLFAAALTCKQFAVLALIPVLAVAPSWRDRLRVLVPAGVVFAAVVGTVLRRQPCRHPRRTRSREPRWGRQDPSAGTFVGLAPLSESSKLVLARLGAMALALLISVVARQRCTMACSPPCR